MAGWTDQAADRLRRNSGVRAAGVQQRQQDGLLLVGPVDGPDGSRAEIWVEPTGFWWRHYLKGAAASGGQGGIADLALLASSLTSQALWLLVFRRSYTVHVRASGSPLVKRSARLPDRLAAYQAAVTLAGLFQAEGTAALATDWCGGVRP